MNVMKNKIPLSPEYVEDCIANCSGISIWRHGMLLAWDNCPTTTTKHWTYCNNFLCSDSTYYSHIKCRSLPMCL